MAGSRYNLIPKGYWDYLGPAYRGLDADVEELEVAVAAGGGGEPAVTDLTTVYNAAKA